MNISLNSVINDRSLGIWSLGILKALSSLGHDIAWFPIGDPNHANVYQNDLPLIKKCYDRQFTYDSQAPAIKIWHPHQLSQTVNSDRRISYTIFELDDFTSLQAHCLKSSQELWVPTKWAQTVVTQRLSKNSKVVPLGVDRQIFNENVKGIPRKSNSPTTFLCIGKIEVRKAHAVLHEVFHKAFLSTDNVKLIMSWTNPFLEKEELRSWEQLYKDELGDQVEFVNWFPNQSSLANLIASCDCVLSLGLAEGWGLPALDALSIGKIVIATDYAGHTEFLNKDNCLLVSPTEFEEAYDGVWFKEGFSKGQWIKWTDNQTEQLINHLRYVHNSKERCGDLELNHFGIQTAKEFTWENTAKIIEGILNG